MTERYNYNINANISSSTFGNILVTGGTLSATFNSNTVGNLYTTGGNVGINTVTPGYTLDVNGDIRTNSFVLQPGIPGFIAYGASSSAYYSGFTVNSVNLIYNNGYSYNAFYAPVAGLYFIWMSGYSYTDGSYGAILKNGGSFSGQIFIQFVVNNGTPHESNCGVYYLNVNDYIQYHVFTGTIYFDSNDSWGAIFLG